MRIVTISRRVGSLGDVIAALVARHLDLELMGRDQIHQLAQTCDPEYSDACTIYETEHGPGLLERIFFDRPSYTSLFESLTYELAAKGNVVIMGRGSQIVLRNVPGVFKTRIVASRAVRVRRIMERFNYSHDEAQDYVRKYDHERRSLTQSIFDQDPTDWALYDVILNTGDYTAGDAADVIVEAVKKKKPVEDEEKVLADLRNAATAKRIETIIRKRLTSVVARFVEVSQDSDGKVTLSGRIRSKKEKQKAGEIAAAYRGVTKVINDLKVTELYFGY